MKKIYGLLLALLAITAQQGMAQLQINDETIQTVIFDDFEGAGFDTPPAIGQLDSEVWRITGMSDGDGTFGGTHDSGDFARGTDPDAATTGGTYAFTDVDGTDVDKVVFGVQPAGTDFTPGEITLKLQNNTGDILESIEVSYEIWVYNDQGRANSFNFAHSDDDATYTNEASADFTTPEAADGSPVWAKTDRTVTINGLNIANGDFYYLQWYSDMVSGSGSVDQFGLGDISITATNIDATAPAITLDQTGFETDFGFVEADNNSSIQSIDISGENLEADITVISDGFLFLSENSDMSSASQSITLTETTGEVTATTIYGQYQVPAGETEGSFSSTITASSTNASDRTVSTSVNRLEVVNNLSALRSGLQNGTVYQLSSEVILGFDRGGSRNQKYIADPTGSILIDDSPENITTSYNVGDGITGIRGDLSSFSNALQFRPIEDAGTATSTGNDLPNVVLSDLAEIRDNEDLYLEQFVKVEEVSFEEAGDNFSDFSNFTLTDGTNTLTYRTQFGTAGDLAGELIPYGRLDVTAIGGKFGGSGQMNGFSYALLEDNYAPEFSTAPAASTPTTSAFDVTFKLDEPGTVYYLVNETTNSSPDVATVLASSETVEYTDLSADGTIELSGLNDNTEYFVHIVAVDDEGTPNEQTSVTTVSATTEEVVFDATSDIVAADATIASANISSLANEDTDAVEVFAFKTTDNNANDSEPTAINTIVIENNNAATWSNIIAGASITDGTTANTATSITDSEITFDLSGSQYFVTGGTEITFTLSVWLEATQTDETELQFTIPTNHSFVADASGSVFKSTLDAAITSAVHTIDVEATTFATTVPDRAKPNTDFSVSVSAEDANGNTDKATRTIDIDATAGNKGASGTLSSATGITGQAMVDGEFTFTDLQYDQVEDIRLTVTDGTISTNTLFFAVTNTQVETFDNYPETGTSYVDGSFEGQDGSTWSYVQTRGDQSLDGASPMLGRGRTPDAEVTSGTISGGIEKLSFDYSQAFSSNVELEVHVNGDSITTVESDNEVGITKNSGEISLEIEGDFTLSFKNPNGGQVNIDNITWNAYEAVCTEPSTQASALNAVVVDNNTIDLDWTAGDGDATIILARANGAVDADPELVTAYTANAAFESGDEIGTGNYVVYAGADANVQVTALSQGTAYHFAAYTYNTSENCYLVESPAVANVTTTSDNDVDSDITAADNPIAVSNVSSVANAEADAVDVFNFKIVDAGSNDGEPTIVNKITISAGASNMPNWTEALSGAAISIGTFSASNATITENAIEFDLSENLMTVNDGADSTVTLSVWLSDTVIDGDTLAFEIPTSHNFTASGDGSRFSETVSGASSAKHLIDVSASTLAVNAPTTAVQGGNFEITVNAEDANGNTDNDDRTVTIAADGSGTLSGTTELALTDGAGTFSGLSYDAIETITLTISDGTISETASISITEQATEITETFDNFDYTGSTYADGTFTGQDGSTWTYVQARGDVAIDGASPMLGRNRTPQAYLESGVISGGIQNLSFDYAQAFSSDVSLEVYVNNNLVETVTSTGQQGITLNSGDILVEVPGDFTLKFSNPAGGQVNIDNVNWTSFTSTEPVITVDQTDFESNFGEIVSGTDSPASSFVVNAQNLEDALTITIPTGFQASINADFSTVADIDTPLAIEPTEGNITDASVYVRFAPSETGTFSGNLTLNSLNATERTVSVSGIAVPEGLETVISQNFDNCDALNGFTSFSVIGEQVWDCDTDGFDGAAVSMNGFSDGALDNEDWLISPSIDLSNYDNAELDFYTRRNFSGGDFKIYVSENYVTGEDPSAEAYVWTEITTATLSDGSWVSSGPIALAGTDIVHVAFVYTSNPTDGAAEWLVDNFRVRGVLDENAPNIILTTDSFNGDFGKVLAGQTSDVRNYSLSAVNLTSDVTVNIPEGFEMSLTANFDGDIFTQESDLVITQTDGSIAETILYVRFTPSTEQAKVYDGDIEHSSDEATIRSLAVSGQEGEEGGVIAISAARGLPLASEVRITGVVIGGPNNESANRIISDDTGGIVIRETNNENLLTASLGIGDSVVVTGSLGQFSELIQVSSLTELEVIKSGSSLPSFETATIQQITNNYENYASRLVKIEGVVFTDEKTTFQGGGADGNFAIEDATGNMTFRIGSADHPLVGQTVPTEERVILGYIGRFNDAIQIFVNDANGIQEPAAEASLVLSAETLDFGLVEIGVNSIVSSFNVQAVALSDNILITTEGDFEVSLNNESDFSNAVTLDLDQEGGFFGDVYVRFVPTVAGAVAGSISVVSGDISYAISLTGEGEEVVNSNRNNIIQGVEFYPNPTNELLMINLQKKGEFSYQMISVQGIKQLEGLGNDNTVIDLSGFNAGIYILRLEQDGKQFNTRIIKK